MPSGLSVLVVEKAVSMMSLRLDRLARPGMQPSLAHEPKATTNLRLAPQQLGEVDRLVGPHAAADEGDGDLAVGHGLDVGVLAVHDRRPQDDVEGRGHFHDVLVDVDDGDVAAAARGGAEDGELGLRGGLVAPLDFARARLDARPGSRACRQPLPHARG